MLLYRARVVVCLAAVGAVGCQSFVGDYTADLAVEAPISGSRLCDIERAVYAISIDRNSKQALDDDLVTYYAEQNAELMGHIEEVGARWQAFEAGEENSQPQTGVTYLSGAAGVGKSFVLGGLAAFDSQCEVDLDDLFGDEVGELEFEVTDLADLATLDGDVVFNELPTLAKPAEFTLESLLTTGGCYGDDGELVPFVFIDGIDEVHEETAGLLLEAIDEFVVEAQDSGRFLHLLVAGRPEGFASWLTDPDRNQDNNRYLNRFDLEPPRYDTAGDLEFRATGYWDFIEITNDLRADGVLDAYLERFEETVATYPFLTYSLGNLAYGNFVVEHVGPGDEEGEAELKAGIFDDILLRDADSHSRPGTESSLNAAYRRALEEVAVRYAEEINDSGVFTVTSEDTVPVSADDGSLLGEVRVRTLLNHSGVAFLTTRATTTRYHFDPFWVHSHLIERYNQRHFPRYAYRGCQ